MASSDVAKVLASQEKMAADLSARMSASDASIKQIMDLFPNVNARMDKIENTMGKHLEDSSQKITAMQEQIDKIDKSMSENVHLRSYAPSAASTAAGSSRGSISDSSAR